MNSTFRTIIGQRSTCHAQKEGVADLRAAHAISASDLVIVPSQGSALEQDNAARAIKLIRDQERPMRRIIPHAVLLTRVSAAIQSRGLKAAEYQLVEHGVEVFETRLIEREAFKALFSFSTTLDDLGPEDVSGLERAWDNAIAFTAEVVQRLKALSGQGRRSGKEGGRPRSKMMIPVNIVKNFNYFRFSGTTS